MNIKYFFKYFKGLTILLTYYYDKTLDNITVKEKLPLSCSEDNCNCSSSVSTTVNYS